MVRGRRIKARVEVLVSRTPRGGSRPDRAQADITILVSEPAACDLVLDELEGSEDLESEIDALLDGCDALALDFRVSPRPSTSLTDAIEVVRERTEARQRYPRIEVYVRSERVRRALMDTLQRGRSQGRRTRIGSTEVDIRHCSIVDVRADAVVNASNTQLHLGGGVSGALRRVAGPELQQAMTALAPIGEASIVATPSFRHSKARTILHVPTAIGTESAVRAGYRNALRYARQHALHRLAVPALGTGTGALPVERCAEILREELTQLVEVADTPTLTIIVALFDGGNAEAFAQTLGAE